LVEAIAAGVGVVPPSAILAISNQGAFELILIDGSKPNLLISTQN
jgi:hypothetical protein